jgi:rod shape-determining protein MreD
MSPRAKVPLLVVFVLLLHTSVLGLIHVDHIRPDGLLLLTVLAGLIGGQQAGTLVGFTAGLLADLTLQTPFGLTALVLTITGYSCGALRATLVRTSWWLVPVTALIASGGSVIAFVLLGGLVGQSQLLRPGPAHMLTVAALVGVMNAILAPAIYPLVRWSFAPTKAERAYVVR